MSDSQNKTFADTAVDAAVGGVKHLGSAARFAVGGVGKLIGSALRMPGMKHAEVKRTVTPGAPPGIEHRDDIDAPPPADRVLIRVIDYSKETVETHTVAVGELETFLATPAPDWVRVRWINVDGLHPWVINQMRLAYGFHTLAAEDVLNVPQRPKLEPYDDHSFVVARMTLIGEHGLRAEQISFMLYDRLLITFQEERGDVFDPIRLRIDRPDSRLRKHGAGYLLYTLLDAIIDHGFPILEQFGDLLERMEDEVLLDPTPRMQKRIFQVKRQLVMLRRVFWPMREMVGELIRSEECKLSDFARTYMRDVYDHAVQVIDIIESYRETASGLNDLFMSAVSNRMNEVMKVLTIIATIFIPLSFIAGLYGMNFENMPELSHPWAYPVALTAMFAVASAMLVWFWRKGWIGSDDNNET